MSAYVKCDHEDCERTSNAWVGWDGDVGAEDDGWTSDYRGDFCPEHTPPPRPPEAAFPLPPAYVEALHRTASVASTFSTLSARPPAAIAGGDA